MAEHPGPSDANLEKFRSILCQHFGGVQRTPPSVEFPTDVFHQLLEAWRCDAGDPETEVAKWFIRGAPAGLAEVPVSCGIFPTTEEFEASPDLDFELRDPDEFQN